MKILVIEDEEKTVNFLKKGLAEQHYDVDTARDGESGLTLALQEEYKLIILDIMLPKINGWQVIESLRASGNKTPVLFLTAMNALPDRVRGLQAGADDYIVKPFAFVELSARVEAILRRTMPVVPQDSFKIEDLTIHYSAQTVTRGNQTIELTQKEFRLLCILSEASGRLVSRQDLSKKVWGLHFDCETNVVDVAIRRLRQKLDDPFEVKLIHTVRGAGYVLEKRF